MGGLVSFTLTPSTAESILENQNKKNKLVRSAIIFSATDVVRRSHLFFDILPDDVYNVSVMMFKMTEVVVG
jgi:hypothetical protein